MMIDPAKCHYPNVIAEMQVFNMDFLQIAFVMKVDSGQEARKILVSGELPLISVHLFLLADFFKKSCDYIREGTIRIHDIEDEAELNLKIKPIISIISKKVIELFDNNVLVTKEEQRYIDLISSICRKLNSGKSVNYAEYSEFLNGVYTINSKYKRWENEISYKYDLAFIEQQPEAARERLITMFDSMNITEKTLLFREAARAKSVIGVVNNLEKSNC